MKRTTLNFKMGNIGLLLAWSLFVVGCLGEADHDYSEANLPSEGTVDDPRARLGLSSYQQKCASCHMDINSSDKENRSVEQIQQALRNIRLMQNIEVSEEETAALAWVLAGNRPSDPTVPDDTPPSDTPTTPQPGTDFLGLSLMTEHSFLTSFSGMFWLTIECEVGSPVVLNSQDFYFRNGNPVNEAQVNCGAGYITQQIFMNPQLGNARHALTATQRNQYGNQSLYIEMNKVAAPNDLDDRFFANVQRNCLGCHNSGSENWGQFANTDAFMSFVRNTANQGGGGSRFPDIENTTVPRRLRNQAETGTFLWRHFYGFGQTQGMMPPGSGYGNTVRNQMTPGDFDISLAFFTYLEPANSGNPNPPSDPCDGVVPHLATFSIRAMTEDEIFNTVADLFQINNNSELKSGVNLPLKNVSARYNTNMTATALPELASGQLDDLYPALKQLSDNILLQMNSSQLDSMYESLAGCSVADISHSNSCLDSYLNVILRRSFKQQGQVHPGSLSNARQAVQIYDDSGMSRQDAFFNAVVQYTLFSPQFLFHSFRGSSMGGGDFILTNFELAHRISFLFWGQLPDQQMLNTDWNALLHGNNPSALRNDLNRLIVDSRSKHFFNHFVKEWLKLETDLELLFSTSQFAGNSRQMADAVKAETENFMRFLFLDNRPKAEILTARHTYLNNTLADLYEVNNISTTATFQRVNYSQSPNLANRMGILSQSLFLTTGSRGFAPSSIRRGATILREVACYTLGNPTGIGIELDEVDRAEHTETALFRMGTEAPGSSCVSCHQHLNPFSFPLETYDRLGRHPAHLADQFGSLPEYYINRDIGIANNPDANGTIEKYDTYYLGNRGGNLALQNRHGASIFGSFQDHQGLINLISESGAFDACFTDQIYDYAIGTSSEYGMNPSSPDQSGTHLAQTCSKNRLNNGSTGLMDLLANMMSSTEFQWIRRN